jgi:CTP synthase
MQVAVIEYARNVAKLEGAHSTEFNRDAPHPVIALITEWLNADGSVEQRDEQTDLGGTMRLGSQQCKLAKGTISRELYGEDIIKERHRHRYEFNNGYRQELEDAGMKVAGTSIDGRLVEMIEIPDHPWFVACQFHPEFTSTPRYGHPLFSGFLDAALKHRDANQAEVNSA